MTVGRIPSVEGGIQPTLLDSKGDLIAASAADTPQRLAVGSNDQVLTADSSTATGLKWATPATGGGMTQIATGTLSGTSVTISSIPTTYKDLVLVVRSFRPTDDGEYFRMRMNGDTGTKYNAQTATQGDGIIFGDSFIQLTRSPDNTATNAFAYMTFQDYTNTTTRKQGFSYATVPDSTTPATVANYSNRTFWYDSTNALTSITLFVAAGNWAAGTYILYGVN